MRFDSVCHHNFTSAGAQTGLKEADGFFERNLETERCPHPVPRTTLTPEAVNFFFLARKELTPKERKVLDL